MSDIAKQNSNIPYVAAIINDSFFLQLEKNDLQQRLTAREQEIADIRRQHEAKEKQIKTQDTSSRLTPKASGLLSKYAVSSIAHHTVPYLLCD